MKLGLRGLVLLMAVLAIGVPTSGARADHVSSCGEIIRSAGCLRFVDFETPETYVLPDSLDLDALGIYHVSGESYTAPPVCGNQFYSTRLRDVVVEPCLPDTFGCGRIVRHRALDDSDCDVWTELAGRRTFVIVDLQGFAAGDTVVAVGIEGRVGAPIPGSCWDYGGLLYQMRLLRCPNALNPVVPSSWGRVKGRYR